MPKTPLTSLAKLSSLRNRERLFQILWGVTRWLTFVLTVLTVAMLLDWWIDRFRETPFWWIRVPLTVIQIVAYVATAVIFIVRSIKGPSMIRLARRVEKRIPEFDHRLITAIQLTRPNARTSGMSQELIGIVTEEAETIAGKHDLMRLADTQRLQWCEALVAVPLAVAAFLLLFFKPPLLFVLLQRQCLLDVEIPRDIHLKNQTKRPWPSGDEVEISYEATSTSGRINPEMKGTAYVDVPGQPLTTYELSFKEMLDDGRAVFAAKVPHSSLNFRHRARIGDGRSRDWSDVEFIPRPAVTIYGAWVSPPDYVPAKPDGNRYEIEMNNGDIKVYRGGRARVSIYVQKEIENARLTLYARASTYEILGYAIPYFDPSGPLELPAGPPITPDPNSLVSKTMADGTVHYLAEFSIERPFQGKGPKPVAYRVEAEDNYGYRSVDNPRRTIEITEPDAPYVVMLPERFVLPGSNSTEEDILEGMPIPLGGRVPIEYSFRSSIGAAEPTRGMEQRLISPARLMFRVVDREGNEGPWSAYVLDEVPQTMDSGEFSIATASFEKLDYQRNVLKNRIEFHAKPSDDPNRFVSRRSGGGRFDFETAKLKKAGPDGKEMDLEIGDKVEFYLEVKDRNPAPSRQPGRSEPRVKEIRSLDEVIRRAVDTINSENKIRDLEKRQQSVFGRDR